MSVAIWVLLTARAAVAVGRQIQEADGIVVDLHVFAVGARAKGVAIAALVADADRTVEQLQVRARAAIAAIAAIAAKGSVAAVTVEALVEAPNE